MVDDDATMLKLVRISLESAGFQVCAALDAAEARHLIAQDSLDIGVALIDYELPGTRLDNLLNEVRTHPKQIRCIVTSGYSLDMLEGFEGSLPGGVDFLKKPFLPRDLIAAVQRAFTKVSGTAS